MNLSEPKITKLVYDKERRTIVLVVGESRYTLTKITDESARPLQAASALASLIAEKEATAAGLDALQAALDCDDPISEIKVRVADLRADLRRARSVT